MADLTTAVSAAVDAQFGVGACLGVPDDCLYARGGEGGDCVSAVWVSPACALSVQWGPQSDAALRGRVDAGFVTVVASFSRMSVTVPVKDGLALLPPMQWPVEDGGRVESTLTFKVGLTGISPNKIGTCSGLSEQVRAMAAPVVYFANPAWTVKELSRNGQLEQQVGSLENQDVLFHVAVQTQYAPSPQQAMVVNALSAGSRVSLAAVSSELEALSAKRRERIAAFLATRGSQVDAAHCRQWMVRCPEHSFSQVGMMCPLQMHEFSEALCRVHRRAHLPVLCSAAQQCLVRLSGGAPCAATALATVHAAAATAERRAALVDMMLREITTVLTCNSTYTFDAGIGGFLFKTQDKKIVAEDRVLSGYTTRGGESQDLCGLMDVGSVRLRAAKMQHARTVLQGFEGVADEGDRQHALNQTFVEANKLRGTWDCEDSAFGIKCPARSVLYYGGAPGEDNAELRAAAELTLRTLLPAEPEFHEPLVSLLMQFRAAMYEIERGGARVLGTSLVFAQSSHISAANAKGYAASELPGSAAEMHGQMLQRTGKLGGHAVFTDFYVSGVETHDGVEVCSIGANWTPHEGTANTRVVEGASTEQVCVQLEDAARATGGRYDLYNGQTFAGDVAHNVMTSFTADSATDATARAPVTTVASKAHFTPSHVHDPSSVCSFYQYAMSMARYYVVTCDGGKDALMRGVRAGALAPCAHLVLSKARPHETHAQMIGVTVPACKRELELLGMVAEATRGLYPSLEELLQSAQQTHFMLMPTASLQLPPDGTKINCFQPAAPLGEFASWQQSGLGANAQLVARELAVAHAPAVARELAAREALRASVGASWVSHLNSHVFGLHFRE